MKLRIEQRAVCPGALAVHGEPPWLLPDGPRPPTSVAATFWEQRSERPPVPGGVSLPCQFVTSSSLWVDRARPGSLSTLVASGGDDALVDMLRRVDSELTGVELLDPSGSSAEISLRHARLGPAPLASFGDGVRRVAALVSAIVSARGGLLLVDEIAASLHAHVLTGVFQDLAVLAAQHDVQVFATTHSLEAIDAVLDAIPEGDAESLAVYHLARSEGAITARRSAGPDVHYLRRERALDVR